MGKSKSSSCLKIITCGSASGDPADGEDLTPAVLSKAPCEKPRWSFRKKSAGHQVLSNNLISEPASIGYSSENPETNTDDFNSPKKLSDAPSKASTEDPAPSSATIPTSLVDPPFIGRSNIITDHNLEGSDSVATVIQAAIRGNLAQRELLKLKNLIKLQAAVRGHLVRRQAVGTLHCIRAIIKMQNLVRARHANRFEASKTYSSTEKLLSNRFACQLLESTPKMKHIHIKCDSSIPNSAWKWLERWMAIISSDTDKQLEQNPLQDYEAANDVVSEPSDIKLEPTGSADPTEGEGNTTTKVSVDQAPEFDGYFSYPKRNSQDHPQLENETFGDDTTTDKVTERASQPVFNSISDQPEFGGNSPKRTAKQASFGPLENEGKKFLLGQRKPCNPAFAAAQSKFEELSSTNTVGRLISPAYQESMDESKFDGPNSQVDSSRKIKDFSSMESSVPHDPRVQIAASECGTEISISSTLDSPDRSEAEGGEIVLEIEALRKGNYVVDNRNATTESTTIDSEIIHSHSNGNLGLPIANADADLADQPSEDPTTSVTKNQIEKLTVPEVHRSSSPEGTPRSHTTAPDSRGTPSSQVAVNPKKSKKDNKTSLLVGKRSPSDSNNGSGGKISTEHLAKDSKSAKRRGSFGTAKTDHVDHEPRVSNSNSLPSYMQATESAKAKAHVSVSPKSSPDVHDKDSHAKKRHSLPIVNGKQELSPRMQRSSSQAQQNLKGNETHSPHNSAERRWQR